MDGRRRFGVGRSGEDAARRFLEARGFRTIETNYFSRWGELDLVMADGAFVVIVEVKRRQTATFGGGEEAVTAGKRRHLARATAAFLRERGWDDRPVRFDVVVVTPGGLQHYPEAFLLDSPFF